jgi:hypothetical protein
LHVLVNNAGILRDRTIVNSGPTMILDTEPRLAHQARRAEMEICRGRHWQSGTWWSLAGT